MVATTESGGTRGSGRGATQGEIGRYGPVAMALHWATALAILLLLGTALLMQPLTEGGSTRAPLLALHISLGVTVLALTVIRLVWRLTHRPPTLPAGMPGWEKVMARIVHTLFYILLLAVPLGGYVVASLHPNSAGIVWFGLAELPGLPPPPDGNGAMVADRVADGHRTLGLILATLAALHIAAALKHHFVSKDGVLARMWPFGR
ncbi:MAG: hypothetical protein RLY86_505 [Pseudomonadota bacterium]|jgi:cytochrome b561